MTAGFRFISDSGVVQIDSDFVYSQVPTCALIGVTDLPFHNL